MSGCRSCGSSELTVFLSLGDLPLADGLLREEDLDKPEPRFPLDVALCRDCSLVQILETVPPEVLFCQDYPYYSSFADELLRHSAANVEGLIESRGLGKKSFVVELASNDGYLLQYFVRRNVPVLGIDPAEGPAKAAVQRGIPTLCKFFGRDLADELARAGKRADVVLANNVLAHVADLNGFVSGVARLLKPDGVAVIEVPYVRDLIDHCEFDTIYHEHLCYFSVTALDALFRRHALFLNRVEHFPIHGGSLRLFVEPVERVAGSVRDYLGTEAQLNMTGLGFYETFADKVQGIKSRLESLLRGLKGKGNSLAAYGAAAKGAVLINYVGIGRDLVDFVADRNVHKQGRFMPGTHLPIVDPAQILERMPNHVLLLPWNFRNEILEQQKRYRELGGKFIIPIPTLEVV